jgi:hypothetical protein
MAGWVPALDIAGMAMHTKRNREEEERRERGGAHTAKP